MDSISGKVVLITGGAGGIGLGVVKTFLENGVKGVALVDINEEVGIKAVADFNKSFGEKRTIFVKTDITNKEELEKAFEVTVKTYNQLDIVINNAGTMNEVQWDKTLAVNLAAVIEGTYLALEKYLPKYRSGEEGVIINTSSVLGLYKLQTSPVYVATKHALIGFGLTLGGEKFYQKYKVRVLTVCPGLISTPMADVLDHPKNVWFPEIMKSEVYTLNPISQPPERVGEALIEIIKRGKTGSVWVTEDDEPVYEVEIPHYRNMKKGKQ